LRKLQKNQLREKYFRLKNKRECYFKNVAFSYPSRKEIKVLNVNFTANFGQKLPSLVLVELENQPLLITATAFYDIDSGEILIDGKYL
jgi:ABC-type multidrug transport system fused ATPase/permease subunit